jgi:hypothetical protein
MIWDAGTITRFSQEGENDFADDYPCILTRYSLSVVANQATYTLPDNVRSIRRITYLGTKLDPLGHRNMREVFNNATQVGTPYWYIFNQIGNLSIQFFPVPPTSINPSGGDLYGSAIPTDVIIEYFMLPDYVNNDIPQYFRRRLVKPYVLKQCFLIEGPGQNLKNVKYFEQKYNYLKDKYGTLLQSLHNKARKLCLNGITGSQFFPGTPILPVARFGIGVQDGE